jgi:transposase-like protein
MIVPARRRRWAEVVPFLAFPPEIRHAIYTTNAVESFHAQLRKALKTREHLPNDEAALKLLFLAARHVTTRMNKSRDWATSAMQFAIYFEGRVSI